MVLDLRMGHVSLSPKRNFFIHEATIDQLLSYSILRRSQIPTSKGLILLVCKTMNYTSTTVLDLWIGHAPYLAKGSLHPRDNWSTTHRTFDYYGTQRNKSRQPISRQPADRPSTQKKVLYIRMLKVLQWIIDHTKTKRILQQLSKPLALAPSY